MTFCHFFVDFALCAFAASAVRAQELAPSYRSFIFRLSKGGPVANGIGQNTFVPVFARISYHLDKRTPLDLYGAALTSGKLRVKNASGNDLKNDRTRPRQHWA